MMAKIGKKLKQPTCAYISNEFRERLDHDIANQSTKMRFETLAHICVRIQFTISLTGMIQTTRLSFQQSLELQLNKSRNY